MESLTIPLTRYLPIDGGANNGAAIVPYLFAQACIIQLRLSLTQRGLPESLVLSGSVGMKEDPITGERSYWLGEEELLFRAKASLQSIRHNDRWQYMYCANFYKPKLLSNPSRKEPIHSNQTFFKLRQAIKFLNSSYADERIEFSLISYDTEVVVIGVRQAGGFLSPAGFAEIQNRILDRLCDFPCNFKVYNFTPAQFGLAYAQPDSLERDFA